MLYKPLISLVMAFAAASSVAASVAPVARDNYAPPNVPSIAPNQCNGHVKCCQSLFTHADPDLKGLGGFSSIPTPNPDVFGTGCADLDINKFSQCSSHPVCCPSTSPNGAVFYGCKEIKN